MNARDRNDHHHTFQRLLQSAQQHDPTFEFFPHYLEHLTRDDLAKHHKAARRNYRATQQASLELRHQSYNELLIKYENDNDPTTQHESKRRAKIVKRTMRSEEIRANFKKIRLSVKPHSTLQGGLTSIMTPIIHPRENTSSGDTYDYLATTPEEEIRWETILDREKMEQHLLEYNRKSFRAAAGTPCGHGVIMDAITFTATSQAAREFTNGILPPEWHGDNSTLREFLASFFAPPTVTQQPPISTTITMEDVIKGFRKWKESTTTSPSGRHLGHYKAIIQDDTLLDCLTKFLSLSTQRGISIRRWQQAVNVLIEKDPGTPKIN